MAKEKRLVCIDTQSHDHHDYDYEEDGDVDELDIIGFQTCSFPSQHHILEDNSEIVVGDTLGLKSTITPDFLRKIQDNLEEEEEEEMNISNSNSNMQQQGGAGGDQVKEYCKPNNLRVGKQVVNKAQNFIANSLIIGSWQWHSKNKGDLIGKCYYAKKKLVWEIIHGSLKSKIEFNWSNIVGITSFINQENLGVFQVELNEAPKFYKESEPQPRKHTIWIPIHTDFTEMQATVCRRHKVLVLPSYLGELNKLYEKLLECDPNLLMLSQMSFPTQNSPYFNEKIYQPLDFDEYGNQTHIPDIFTPDHAQNSSFAMPVMNNRQITANSQAMNWDQGTYYGFGWREDDGGFSDFGLQDEMLYSDNQLPQNDHLEVNPYPSSIMMSSSFMENCDSTILFENTCAIVPHVGYPTTNYAPPIVSTSMTNYYGNNGGTRNNLDFVFGCCPPPVIDNNNIENQTRDREYEQNMQKSPYEKHQHPLIQDNPIHQSFQDFENQAVNLYQGVLSQREETSNSSAIKQSGQGFDVQDDNLSSKGPCPNDFTGLNDIRVFSK